MRGPGDVVMLYDIPDDKEQLYPIRTYKEFELKVKELTRQYPNDLELGGKIRKLVMMYENTEI